MNCVDLFDGNLSDQLRDARAVPDSQYVFLHIPKTAGTSAQRDLAFHFPESIHIRQKAQQQLWAQTIESIDTVKPKLIRGHLNAQHLDELRLRVPSIKAMTYLRHPVKRLISNYLWRRANYRKDSQRFSCPGTFDQFCDQKSYNLMTETLVGKCRTADEAIEKISRQFWFVGLTEYYHLCQATLLSMMGAQYRIRTRKNVTQSEPEETDLVTASGIESAVNSMPLDFAVYEFFFDKWSSKINEVVELLMRVQSSEQSNPTPLEFSGPQSGQRQFPGKTSTTKAA